jgi:hypothetical protein
MKCRRRMIIRDSEKAHYFSAVQNVVIDVVDGARSRQRGPIRVIVVNESHQGATPCK